jgi:radical SAM superfamily enzyme YgiQ (UPF0313 family)
MKPVRTLLISTYDLGRQPFGLASPAAWLRRAGVEVECVDTSRDPLHARQIAAADLVAFYLPMHTATRLAAPLIARVRASNPAATIVAFGLYAPLNAAWLRDRGVTHVLGPESEGDLLALATDNSQLPTPNLQINELNERPGPKAIPHLPFIQPDRSSLPALSRYAALQMPDGTRRVVGNTEATRGCKHLCRHCPIVPVYRGAFRAVPVDVVIDDVRAQIASGARHISFGDPDFFNGPTHARRVLDRFTRECPGVTFDVTIKIEHLLKHSDLLPLLRESGCLFVTSAVESVDDDVLTKLRKGHTRGDFIRAVERCREAGIALSPTFVPFTPWTTLEGYVDLLDQVAALDMIESVAPIQLAIRLLVTAESALLELPDLRALVQPFDGESLTWPWRHQDPRVDALQQQVMRLVSGGQQAPRDETFARIVASARAAAGLSAAESKPMSGAAPGSDPATVRHRGQTPPYLTEAWYCCAEPTFADASARTPEPLDYV